MPLLRQPVIRESDYEQFRKLISELPGDYKKWEYDQRAEARKWVLEWQGARPEDVIGVEVVPAEFEEWCKKTGNIPSLHALNNYAYAKATESAPP